MSRFTVAFQSPEFSPKYVEADYFRCDDGEVAFYKRGKSYDLLDATTYDRVSGFKADDEQVGSFFGVLYVEKQPECDLEE